MNFRMAIPQHERERILAIAREVRRHVRRESGAYCPPEGLCGEASLALSTRLTRAGIPHEIWGGRWLGPIYADDPESMPADADRQHAFVVFPQYDRAILDVTADQFSDHPFIKPIWFPAKKEWYEFDEKFDTAAIFQAAGWVAQKTGKKSKPLISLAGPRFRRPLKAMKVRVRGHLKHPGRSCLCNRSKHVDRVRRKLVRRLE